MTIVVLPDGTVERATLAPQISSGLEVDSLIRESYPRLPHGSLSIGDTWDAPLRVALERTTVDLGGKGKLLGFDLARRRRLARIEISRSGRVTSVQPVEQVQLSISGTTNSTTTAMIDVDAGILFSAESVSTSQFEIGAESGMPSATHHITVRTTIESSG
jgi:hypothetical protein